MRHPGAVCHRDQLLSDIWGPEDASSNVVDVCVLRLRRRLGPTVQIETVRGVGYCIEAA
jgi:DNA-binding response OmpR family regulator